MSMNKIKKNGMEIQFDEKTLAFSFKKEGQAVWTWEADYAPYMECGNEKLYFRDALEIPDNCMGRRRDRRCVL